MAPGSNSKLIFSSSVEPLIKISWEKLKPETKQQLNALRIGPPHKTEPAYPEEVWARAVKIIGGELFPGVAAEEQHRSLGRATVEQFTEGVLGKAMFSAARLFGTRRTLERLSHNLRSGANFIETRFTVLGPDSYELWLNDVSDVPGFYAGLLSAGSGKLDGWPDRIEIKQRDGVACLYAMNVAR
ncbi:MAG: hypothetical protein DI536_08480 [Archangium gephyra]|uniref:TIGR02265 family protein n=1 Tax=Archangium gephyra TaxID=48 RepID=A0A2W5VHQ1_9BACT|nr:MAG: hypothetical protein DI536_08480 [Archangium gephyra]